VASSNIGSDSTNSSLQSHYDRLYAQTNYFGHREKHYDPFVRALVKVSALQPGSTLLDVGCGQGFFSSLFARHGMKVVGIDFSKQAVEVARAEYHGLDLEFIACDALLYKAQVPFDCIFTRSCSLYNRSPFESSFEVTRVLLTNLRNNGVFVFVYNTNLREQYHSGAWLNHAYKTIRRCLMSLDCAEMRFFVVNKLDMMVFGDRCLNVVLSLINRAVVPIARVGCEVVCVFRKK